MGSIIEEFVIVHFLNVNLKVMKRLIQFKQRAALSKKEGTVKVRSNQTREQFWKVKNTVPRPKSGMWPEPARRTPCIWGMLLFTGEVMNPFKKLRRWKSTSPPTLENSSYWEEHRCWLSWRQQKQKEDKTLHDEFMWRHNNQRNWTLFLLAHIREWWSLPGVTGSLQEV